jgi:hypothetical protein
VRADAAALGGHHPPRRETGQHPDRPVGPPLPGQAHRLRQVRWPPAPSPRPAAACARSAPPRRTGARYGRRLRWRCVGGRSTSLPAGTLLPGPAGSMGERSAPTAAACRCLPTCLGRGGRGRGRRSACDLSSAFQTGITEETLDPLYAPPGVHPPPPTHTHIRLPFPSPHNAFLHNRRRRPPRLISVRRLPP